MDVREKAAAVRRRVTAGRDTAERVAELEERVRDLEEQVAEGAQLHHRFAELLDVVTELLVPLAQQDDAARARVQKYVDELGS